MHLKVWLYNFIVAPLLGQELERIIGANLREYYKNQRDNHQELMKVQLENQDIVSRAFREGTEKEEPGEQRHKELMQALQQIAEAINHRN